MRCGRIGLADQSQKKPKISKEKKREDMWWYFGPNNEKNSVFLLEGFVDVMKRMDPQQLANILVNRNVNRQIYSSIKFLSAQENQRLSSIFYFLKFCF